MKKILNMLFAQAFMPAFTAFGPAKAKTVDSVLAIFNKTIDDLKAVEAAERLEAEKQELIADAALQAKAAADAEATRASKAVTRFSKLVGEI